MLLLATRLVATTLETEMILEDFVVRSSEVLRNEELVAASSSVAFLVVLVRESRLARDVLAMEGSMEDTLSALRVRMDSRLAMRSSDVLEGSNARLAEDGLLGNFALGVYTWGRSDLPECQRTFLSFVWRGTAAVDTRLPFASNYLDGVFYVSGCALADASVKICGRISEWQMLCFGRTCL